MPAVTSGKVLVTGANGFIGVWTVKAFLDAGFSVRAQVRSESKTAHLKSLFSSFGDKLEFAIVADLTKDGSLDDAVAGVVAVAHTASPTNLLADHPDEHIKPAVEGTLNCLRAAAKGSSVKRFLYLSSCATVVDPSATGPRVYDESCWNTVDDAEVKAKGRAASQLSKYRASKILAERSAWKFYEEAKATGSIVWDLTVVNPPWVFGPSIQELGESYESMNASDQHLYKAIVKGDYYAALDHSWIDVRDLAHALVLAITTPAAGGERFIVAGGDFRWQDFILAASRISDKARPLEGPYDPNAEHTARQNVTKAKNILGMTYHSMEETVRDTVKDWEAHGWL
ncbi:NAD(P)-binding protein [Lentinus tigrinus ALCF2SS1-7]|uniref:NAD(P)-binding protein n=1 Tax=Lentinus tigrinus ALCF2SS1-6 TaxID=1328759 RepID=A0A5C2SPL0_9APHY|nr:NAD(P)-binding protein [Lentinus tigrinus ALCF2SS1-6]RPD79317.1 NAD(P)-binding protein [Lentinus tigrinus ALCF2SS1-7]